jgi:hypothetical protein
VCVGNGRQEGKKERGIGHTERKRTGFFVVFGLGQSITKWRRMTASWVRVDEWCLGKMHGKQGRKEMGRWEERRSRPFGQRIRKAEENIKDEGKEEK